MLNTNVNARKGKSVLDTLSENEMFEAEKVARNWATKVGIDVESVLTLD